MFPFLTVFMIFIIALAIRFRVLDKRQEEKEEAFWDRERQANITLAKDITNLPYITIPTDKFPLNFSEDPEVLAIEEELVELSTHKLLNLTGKTNTDLKLEYGVPNFPTMQAIGEDYDRLTVLLNSYAKILVNAGMFDEAIAVLEFAVGTKTDVSESYVLLAACYYAAGNDDKIQYLIDMVNATDFLMKPAILSHIDAITHPPVEEESDPSEPGTNEPADTDHI